MVRGIIIGHGDFAEAMLNTAQQIVGEQTDVDIISNKGLSCDDLCNRIAKVLDSRRDQDTIIFLDLPGGSCTISCHRLLKEKSTLNMISGINLPMLIEFFMLRNKHRASELVPILIRKGKDNIIQLNSKK